MKKAKTCGLCGEKFTHKDGNFTHHVNMCHDIVIPGRPMPEAIMKAHYDKIYGPWRSKHHRKICKLCGKKYSNVDCHIQASHRLSACTIGGEAVKQKII